MTLWRTKIVLALTFAGFCCLSPGRARAAVDGSYPKTPKAVMEKYLQLEGDGASLSAKTWPDFAKYTTSSQAPAWSTFVVIDRYELGKVLTGTTRAQAVVTYHPLGKLSDNFAPDTKLEVVTYHLNKTLEGWKVDTQIVPHITWGVMKRRLEAASAADAKVKAANDALIAQITSAKQSLK